MVNADASEKISVEAILGRIMAVLAVKNDRQLSIKAGVSPTTISTWRKKARIPYEFATRIAQEYPVTLDYLLLGREHTEHDQHKDRFGLVNAAYFRTCYEAAEIIAKREPGFYTLDVAFVLYNSMYIVFRSFELGEFSREDVLRSLDYWNFIENKESSSVAEYIIKKLEERVSAVRSARHPEIV